MKSRSLRYRLIVLQLAVLAPLWLLMALLAYRETLVEVDEMFDSQLEQVAATLFQLDLSQIQAAIDAPAFQQFNDDDAFVAQIWTEQGEILLKGESAPLIPFEPAPARLAYLHLAEGDWRVLRVHDKTSRRWLAVARPLHEREELAASLAAGLAGPWVVSLTLMVGLLWWAVGRGLAPLAELSRQVAGRRPDDLAPLAVRATPQEAAPLLAEINLLLARVSTALDNERRFTADASHELRTPLAAIRAQVEVAQGEVDPARRQQALQHAIQGIERASRLTSQLLTLARLDHLAGLDDLQRLDLHALVRSVLADASSAALQQHVDLALEGDGGLVTGSEGLLRLAIRNLVDNAVAHSPAGGQVLARVETRTQGVSLTVCDAGPGVPDAVLAKLGERFFRAGSERPGSGLGLSIVRRVAALHGATLQFSNTGGLRVSLLFPAEPHSGSF
ncbi:ATP-binding protein [Chitinimonas sp. BJYL2]|uniref:ATP-binding protein n=1 Tax=Chitinimonas sp. BJYL2 TaxID=2976696 RepID=UPI0022B31954|nr:ATP-binding protein [Chitinimonas sp. BJYL2]